MTSAKAAPHDDINRLSSPDRATLFLEPMCREKRSSAITFRPSTRMVFLRITGYDMMPTSSTAVRKKLKRQRCPIFGMGAGEAYQSQADHSTASLRFPDMGAVFLLAGSSSFGRGMKASGQSAINVVLKSCQTLITQQSKVDPTVYIGILVHPF